MAEKPKRPLSAYMLWLNDNREQIKRENPGIKVTEVAKRGGELWRGLKDKSKWEQKATEDKEKYNKAIADYEAQDGGKDCEKKKADSGDNVNGAYRSKFGSNGAENHRPIVHRKEKIAEKPKRPLSAYMLWLNDNREQVKRDSPGIKVTEVAKRCAELWRGLKDKGKWEQKAIEAKDEYNKAVKKYNGADCHAEDFEKKTSDSKKNDVKNEEVENGSTISYNGLWSTIPTLFRQLDA